MLKLTYKKRLLKIRLYGNAFQTQQKQIFLIYLPNQGNMRMIVIRLQGFLGIIGSV